MELVGIFLNTFLSSKLFIFAKHLSAPLGPTGSALTHDDAHFVTRAVGRNLLPLPGPAGLCSPARVRRMKSLSSCPPPPRSQPPLHTQALSFTKEGAGRSSDDDGNRQTASSAPLRFGVARKSFRVACGLAAFFFFSLRG